MRGSSSTGRGSTANSVEGGGGVGCTGGVSGPPDMGSVARVGEKQEPSTEGDAARTHTLCGTVLFGALSSSSSSGMAA